MNISVALLLVIFLALVVFIGISGLGFFTLFVFWLPSVALATFLVGLIIRVWSWARSPVPFRITTTCGQQKTHPWIKASYLEAPYSALGVICRMALEILLFRSLFRNTKSDLNDGKRLVYGSNKYLWLGGLVFHWSFLIIFLRHYRFFAEPVPFFVTWLQYFDGFMQIGVPILYVTDIALVGAASYLFLRRVFDERLRYISLLADYFPLFLILGIATTGILMRYFYKTDIVTIKKITMGLLSLNFAVPQGLENVGILFFIHLFYVTILLAYFPFSKLTHMIGVFLSPTRNLANNNRMKRHLNPWDYPVKVHTYEEWEEELKDKLIQSGYELERE